MGTTTVTGSRDIARMVSWHPLAWCEVCGDDLDLHDSVTLSESGEIVDCDRV